MQVCKREFSVSTECRMGGDGA